MKEENFAFVAPASNFAGRSSRGCGCKFLRDIMRLPLARPSKFLFDAGATKVKNVAAFAKSCRNECRLAIRIVDGETRTGVCYSFFRAPADGAIPLLIVCQKVLAAM